MKLLNLGNASPAQATRFRREYEMLQALDIAGVVKPLALLDEHGRLTIDVGDIVGESLEAILNRRRLDLPTCLRLARQLTDILSGLHASHIIHQDIRPVNLLVMPEARICLLDLSLAISDTQQMDSANNPSMKAWPYVSPEQTGRMSRLPDYRTDFYSLGVTLYRMLTGQLPFAAADPLEWAYCHIARIPPSLRELVPELPQVVADIVMKLLAKLPEERYQSAYGLRCDLDRCVVQWQANERIDAFPLGVEDFSERFHIPHKLYGREREMAALLSVFECMAASGRRALVSVSGYAGVGKSSLVEALRPSIVEKHGYFITGKFDQYLHDIPYATIIQACRELMRQLLAESETRIAGWRQRMQEAVGANGQLIVDVLPQVELIIGKQPPVPELPPIETQNRFRRVFRQFLEVFAQKAHPLVIFLDDLQWIDAASLQLIEYLFADWDQCYLLLIGAYRDNEVSAAHPLLAGLDAIRRGGTAVEDVRLAPLSVESLNRLVADILHAQQASCESLTRLIFAKTEGNPLFFTQFLALLHKEGWLRYDATAKAWRWDLDRIQASDFADNVADLMAGKLRRLPLPTQKLLQLSACLGNKFDWRILALISRMTEDEVEQHLSVAFQEGVIMRTDGMARFLHDRIQQAAYSLIRPEQRSAIHLQIGRALFANLDAEALASQLFDVANQFNIGVGLLVDPQEKAQVAALNLRAGRKAKASAAYASACVYLAAGMDLLEEKDWKGRYALMFGLWLERANCEFLVGHFDEAARLIATLLQRGASKIDLAEAYRLKILLHVVKSENPQAVDSGVACLRLFDIDLPPHPTDRQVQAEYDTMWRNLGNRPIESLIELPLMTATNIQAVTNVLSDLINPGVFTDMNFTRLLYCHIVNLSLKHGVAPSTAYGYVVLGCLLGPDFHRYHDGYRFVRLAVDLVEKHGFIAEQARIYFVMGIASIWTQPIGPALEYGQKTFRAGVESGDLAMACYGWIILTAFALFRGAPLEDVWRVSEDGIAFCRKSRFRDVADILISHQQFIKAMQGRTVALSTFNDAQFDETAFEAQLTAQRMKPMGYWYWSMKLQGRFMAGDYAGTLSAAEQAKALLSAVVGQVQTLYYHYYTALAITAMYPSGQGNAQCAWREQLATHQEQLREWAENCYSPTFRDKHALVAAEIARLDGHDLDAMRLYRQAIESAHDNGFVQNEGIARELAARFYLARGFTTEGNAHLAQARHCFVRWGADGKVAQLDARYPSLRPMSAVSTAISSDHGDAQLDLLSVAKASQAISGRILLSELVDTLMRTVLENAGAQNGALLLVRNQELRLAADARMTERQVEVRSHLGQTLPPSISLPASILNYVRRSREQVLLADVAQPSPFSGDTYFSSRHPKSALCLPILRQAVLVGVLYLENKLVTHAFTPARLTVLELLAAQAAISLENALLYADLHEREARIHRLVESNIIGINFWDVRGAISDANEAFLRIVGYSRQDVLSGHVQWTSMTPPEYRNADAQAMQELQRTGSITRYEKELICKDGRRVPIMMGATFLEGSQEQGVAFVLDQTEQKQAEARIRHMAHYDALTGLPNRVLLQDRVKQAIAYAHRSQTRLAILFVDLDYFKHVNDSLGHAAGDSLLQMAAARLQQCLREGDSVSRWGGDEFVLSLSLLYAHDAVLVAQKVFDALSQAFVIDGHELHVSCSIGISLYPDDGADAASLMRTADMAMYHAKESGRDNYQFFTPALNKAAQQRLEAANRLSHALANNELMLYYQPQVSMETGAVFSAEALLRWRQPGASPVSCGTFIAIAEETGLILQLGEWTLREACRQLKQWHAAGHSQLHIAVNLSPRQFYQHNLLGTVENILREAQLPAAALDLEITESLLLQHSEDNLATLHRLSDMGIQLSVDDFGTGYSSLAYLQRFPIDALKIDQSFVRGIGENSNDTALVTAIIGMANSLHLKVLAEGVETPQQAGFLLSHGCLAAQGFYYSKAVPADVFINLLEKQGGRVSEG